MRVRKRSAAIGAESLAASAVMRRTTLVLVPSAPSCGPDSRSSPAWWRGSRSRSLVLGGIVAFAPDPVPAATPVPIRRAVRRRLVTRRPSVGASAVRLASAAAPAASDGAALFHVGEPAPPLVVPQVGGGTIDLANLAVSRSGSTSWARTVRRASTSSRS